MNYHNIEKYNMINGEGLRTVLFVAGCSHHCKGCQNPQTWDSKSGIPFDSEAKLEIIESLKDPSVSGLTLSGGDPLYSGNIKEISELVRTIKYIYPEKNIWLYTGFIYEDLIDNRPIIRNTILPYIDIIVDGEFVESLKDIDLNWIGSSNQRLIDVQKSLENNVITLYKENSKDNNSESPIRKSY